MEDKVLAEYFELLRYESVGADPAHLRDCVSCASWLRKWLGKLGFSAELVYPKQEAGSVPPPPVLFAQRDGGEGAPTVLVYGHYDVQPADPSPSGRRLRSSRRSLTDASTAAARTTTKGRLSRSCVECATTSQGKVRSSTSR